MSNKILVNLTRSRPFQWAVIPTPFPQTARTSGWIPPAMVGAPNSSLRPGLWSRRFPWAFSHGVSSDGTTPGWPRVMTIPSLQSIHRSGGREELDTVARDTPGSPVISGSDPGDLFDAVQHAEDLRVEPTHPSGQACKRD